jgi:hypothetical protein
VGDQVRFRQKVSAAPAGAFAADSLSLKLSRARGRRSPRSDVLKDLYAAGLAIAEVAVRTSSREDVLLRVLRGFRLSRPTKR